MPAEITVTLKCDKCKKTFISRGLNPSKRRAYSYAADVFTVDREEPTHNQDGSVLVSKGIWTDFMSGECCLCSIECALKVTERELRRMFEKPKGKGKR